MINNFLFRNETKPQASEEASGSEIDKNEDAVAPKSSMSELYEVVDSETSSDALSDRIVPLAPKEDDVDDEIEADSDSTSR